MAMQPNQWMIVRLSPDMRNYVYWTADVANSDEGLPDIPPTATSTTSASTLGTAVQNNMPTLSS